MYLILYINFLTFRCFYATIGLYVIALEIHNVFFTFFSHINEILGDTYYYHNMALQRSEGQQIIHFLRRTSLPVSGSKCSQNQTSSEAPISIKNSLNYFSYSKWINDTVLTGVTMLFNAQASMKKRI